MMLPLGLLLVACLLPPPRGDAAAAHQPAAASVPAVVDMSSSTATAGQTRFRLSVDNHYTMSRKRPRSRQHDLTPAALRAPGVGGDAESTVTERIGERIIRVPHRRVSTGCRIYQRMDRLGQCRNRW